VAALGDRLILSLAHLRWSQGEAGKSVLDGHRVVVDAPREGDPHAQAFTATLALDRQPPTSLLTLYQGWMDVLLALEAARKTGIFEVAADARRRAARCEALRECARLEAEMARLRVAAANEKQMPRQVELNLALKRAEVARATALARL
jgi:hypothetical protein